MVPDDSGYLGVSDRASVTPVRALIPLGLQTAFGRMNICERQEGRVRLPRAAVSPVLSTQLGTQ